MGPWNVWKCPDPPKHTDVRRELATRGFQPRGTPKILITGASGFLGRALVREFQNAGARIRTTGRRVLSDHQLGEYLQADLCHPPDIARLVEGVDVVVHAAGLAHQFPAKAGDARKFLDTNATATENLAMAAAAAGVRHFLQISSVSVYGLLAADQIDETCECRPTGPYAESKYLAEQAVRDVAGRSGMRCTVLRMATIYGEEDPGNVARLMRAIARGRFLWIGDGENQKTLIHRDDAAVACRLAAARNFGPRVETYNVAAPPCTMREIVTGLAMALGRPMPRWRVSAAWARRAVRAACMLPLVSGRALRLQTTLEKWLCHDAYDGGRFQREFDYVCQVSLAEGLAREVAWFRGATPVFTPKVAA